MIQTNSKRSNRADDKVEAFIKPSREKATLVAIARRADPDGDSVFVSISYLQKVLGYSRRTVQRHIRTLEERGDLVIETRGHKWRGTNQYFIPCCQLSVEELELITGVAEEQLSLNIISPELKGDTMLSALGSIIGVRENAVELLTSFHSEDGRQNDAGDASPRRLSGVTVTPNQPIDQHLKGLGVFTKKMKREKSSERAAQALIDQNLKIEETSMDWLDELKVHAPEMAQELVRVRAGKEVSASE